jgi:hypothetical protein
MGQSGETCTLPRGEGSPQGGIRGRRPEGGRGSPGFGKGAALREAGRAARGRGAMRRGNRKDAGEGVTRPRDPSSDHTRELGGEDKVLQERRRQNLLRGLPPRGSRGRRPGLPAGSAGPARRGEDGMGETQRETLMPGRRGPRARPAPAAPTARPVLGTT